MKKVLILGFGISGIALANYFLEKGVNVHVMDKKPQNEKKGILFLLEGSHFESFEYDLVVFSPGIDKSHYAILRALKLGINVQGEAEFSLSLLKKHKIVAVTGSNGKSTTLMLIHHFLNEGGIKARALGNIGTPLISAVSLLQEDEVIVAELSSFQLEGMKEKVFDVGVLLNLTPNHLDRHKTMEAYLLAKLGMLHSMKRESCFFVQDKVYYDYESFFKGQKVHVLKETFDFKIPNHLFPIRSNIFFARAVAKQFGLSDSVILKAMDSFKTLKHRLEYVGQIDGIKCYNDSKSTTIDSTIFAVEALKENIVLICGGRFKGGSFSKWRDAFLEKVKAVIVIGEAKELISKELDGLFPIYIMDTLEKSIEKGLQLAKRGDNLILSPGCSSLDMFSNFEERGELFKRGLERESERYNTNFSTC